jgi:hypothetical protein
VWNILPIPGAPLDPANWHQVDRSYYSSPRFVYVGPDPTSGAPRVTPSSIQWPVRTPEWEAQRAAERERARRERLLDLQMNEWHRLRELWRSQHRSSAFRPSSRPGPSIDSQAARNLLFWNMNHIEPLLITEPGRQYEDPCPICYHDFSRTATDRMPVRIKDVEGCKDHVFCNKCIIKSITSGMDNANKCPLCRTELMAAEGHGQRLRPPHADVSEPDDEGEVGAVQNSWMQPHIFNTPYIDIPDVRLLPGYAEAMEPDDEL